MAEDDYNLLRGDLTRCLAGTGARRLRLGGAPCASSSRVRCYSFTWFWRENFGLRFRPQVSVITEERKGGASSLSSRRYSRSSYTFRLGLEVVLVDAAWGVFDFVHGFCYGAFDRGANRHHLYQRATEALFRAEITFRR